jgi:hypothetical protein
MMAALAMPNALAMLKASQALVCRAYQRVFTLGPPWVVAHLIRNPSDDIDGATEFGGAAVRACHGPPGNWTPLVARRPRLPSAVAGPILDGGIRTSAKVSDVVMRC